MTVRGSSWRKVPLIVSRLDALTPYQVGWLAGMLDGEGTITIRKNSRNDYSFLPMVIIASTTPQLVETLVEMTGMGRVRTIKTLGNRKPLNLWSVASHVDVLFLLIKLIPHLLIKKAHAKLTLKFCVEKLSSTCTDPKFYYNELHKLNKRGRR